MKHWIKICGNTSLEDARLAVEAGADALGFVFAASPRRVTVTQAAGIVQQLPVSVEKIGVFVDAGLDEIADVVRACGLTGVQLHFDSDAALAAELKKQLGRETRILQAVHFGEDAEMRVTALAADANVDGVLVDSRTAAAVGGTGVAFDWEAARRSLFQDTKKHLIAAGGLTPANVAEAIAILRPWGVDVASGVEVAAGRKDAAKVRAFVAAVRTVVL